MELNRDTPIEVLTDLLRQPSLPSMPDGWWFWENVHEAHRLLAREVIEHMPPPADEYHGRGIVIGAGGPDLFTNAYVCVRMLRYFRCEIPVQFWHYAGEIDEKMQRIVAPLGVACINANEVEGALSGRRRPLKRGWELKPFALLHSPYREVMLLDADNVPVVDPTFLFDTTEFRETGAIFWPDYDRLQSWRHIWSICEVPYRDEPEIESGQVVVDKHRCWEALNLAVQHCNMDKWKLDASNSPVIDFWFEDLCRHFLAELRSLWSGRVF